MPPFTRPLSRRDAIKRSAALAAPLAVPASWALGQTSSRRPRRLRVGLIGCGVRGKYLIANLPEEAQVVALCDCSLGQVESVLKPTGEFREPLARFNQADGPRCSVSQDYREMIGREAIDAVIIAAPDHHHALAAILACQAGLDVYVEKPLSLTIAEGRAIAAAVQATGRIVQVGSQQRTMGANRFACEFIRDGGLGKVSLVETRNFPGPIPCDSMTLGVETIPADMDWEMFCGPTPWRPYNRKMWMKDAFKVGDLLWRGWDLFREYSGHLTTNWGAHGLDMIQYALRMDDSGPVEVWPDEDRLDGSADDEWLDKSLPLGTLRDARVDRMRFCPVSMRYANGTVVRFVPRLEDEVFHGERGTLHLRRNHYATDPPDLAPPPDAVEAARWEGEGNVARPHLENWLDAILRGGTLNAPVEAGHRTATVCHLVNICRELGRRLRWDPAAERFIGDDEANGLIDRPRRPGFELPRV